MFSDERISFQEALRRTADAKRSVLLGNGFSIDLDASFSYPSLAERAVQLGNSPITSELREAMYGTADFETIAHYLEVSARVLALNGEAHADVIEELKSKARRVRLALVDTLATVIPESANAVPATSYRSARAFLSEFGTIFTLSYDPLLYWVMTRPKNYGPCVSDDGFSGRERMTWGPSKPCNVFFLHGALHIYRTATDTAKVKHRRGRRMADQIKDRIRSGEYPLVVTEGTSEEKKARIQGSDYLTAAHRALSRTEGALFVHGAAMDEKDEHVFSPLASRGSRVTELYVALHSGSDAVRNAQTQEVARRLEQQRASTNNPMAVRFYRSETARVWR